MKYIKLHTGFFLSALFLALAFFILPSVTFAADFAISEIMYDLKGTDTNREWIEIQNVSNYTINVNGFHISDSGGDHSLKLIEGSEEIPAGAVFVIVKDKTAFKNDFPQMSGTLFDSTFDLGNTTADTIILKSKNKEILDSIKYDTKLGASGSGKSLQNVGGIWKANIPSPGIANGAVNNIGASSSGTGSGSGTGNTSTTVSSPVITSSGAGVPVYDPRKKNFEPFYRITTPATDTVSLGQTYTLPLKIFLQSPESEMEKKSGKVYVNFGDGNEVESDLKNPITHTYTGAGMYQINITYYSSNLVKVPDSEKAYTVRVLDTASLLVEEKNGFMIFRNQTKDDIDIGGMSIFKSSEKDKKLIVTIANKTRVIANQSLSLDMRKALNGNALDLSATLFILKNKEQVFLKNFAQTQAIISSQSDSLQEKTSTKKISKKKPKAKKETVASSGDEKYVSNEEEKEKGMSNNFILNIIFLN